MNVLFIIIAVVLFLVGNFLMSDFMSEWVVSLGMLLMFFGLFFGIMGLMMIPPL